MLISEAVKALLGAPMLVALRQGGPILIAGDRGSVIDLQGPKPRRYVGKMTDYVAIDWEVMSRQQFGKMLAEQRAASAAAAAGDEGVTADER